MSSADVYPLVRLESAVDVLDHLRVPVNSDERAKRVGDVPYYGANGQRGWIDRALFSEPLILLAEDGGNFDDYANRPIAYRIDGPSWVNNHAHVIRSKNRSLHGFIFWSLAHKDIRRYIAGGTRTKLTRAELRQIEIPMPSVREGKLVGDILDTLEEQISQTKTLIAKLDHIRHGLLTDLLTRGIDHNGLLRPPPVQTPQLYKDSPLGKIPNDWQASTIKAEFQVELGKMLDGEKNTGDLKPYLGNKAVQWERIEIAELGLIRLAAAEQDRYRLQKGDLLVCEGGEIGRAAIWEEQLAECYYQKALHRLRPIGNLLPEMMLYKLRYFSEQNTFARFSTQTSIAHLTKEKLETLPVAVPPSAEQELIISVVNAHKNRKSAEESKLHQLEKLKSGLMDDLLTGRVRVAPLLEAAGS